MPINISYPGPIEGILGLAQRAGEGTRQQILFNQQQQQQQIDLQDQQFREAASQAAINRVYQRRSQATQRELAERSLDFKQAAEDRINRTLDVNLERQQLLGERDIAKTKQEQGFLKSNLAAWKEMQGEIPESEYVRGLVALQQGKVPESLEKARREQEKAEFDRDAKERRLKQFQEGLDRLAKAEVRRGEPELGPYRVDELKYLTGIADDAITGLTFGPKTFAIGGEWLLSDSDMDDLTSEVKGFFDSQGYSVLKDPDKKRQLRSTITGVAMQKGFRLSDVQTAIDDALGVKSDSRILTPNDMERFALEARRLGGGQELAEQLAREEGFKL